MFETYSGATRIVPLLGYPIAQAKSPFGMTKGFAARGADCIVVPVKIPPDGVGDYLKALDRVENLAGVLATVPHKFALAAHADRRSDRAAFYGSANIMRRDRAGFWLADMLDGLGFIRAIRAAGGLLAGRRALLAGAGGAGGAIAMELLTAGVERLAVHDTDPARRDDLIARLDARFADKAAVGSASPRGFEVIVNATPLGMQRDDPLPFETEHLTPEMFVGDVVSARHTTPLLAAAGARGCRTADGHDMFEATLDLMLDFFLGAAP